MIAIVVLLLTMVLSGSHTADPAWIVAYRTLIRETLFVLAVLIIVAWILSIDILDTIMNRFKDPPPDQKDDIRRYMYRHLAPTGLRQISGGVSYGYLAFALLGVFIPMCMSYFVPILGGYGATLYVYLGYPYFYGYCQTHTGISLDEDRRWPSLTVGLTLLVGTVVARRGTDQTGARRFQDYVYYRPNGGHADTGSALASRSASCRSRSAFRRSWRACRIRALTASASGPCRTITTCPHSSRTPSYVCWSRRALAVGAFGFRVSFTGPSRQTPPKAGSHDSPPRCNKA